MTNKLLGLASILVASLTTAAAAPSPPTPPGPPAPNTLRRTNACERSGDVLFEIDQRTNPSVQTNVVDSSELVLYATGGWSFTSHDANHKLLRTASGCIDDTTLRTIRQDLQRATWTVKTADAACAAISGTVTVFSSHGKEVWSQTMCQLEYLDATSQKSLDEIVKILDDASAPKTPPCCKN